MRASDPVPGAALWHAVGLAPQTNYEKRAQAALELADHLLPVARVIATQAPVLAFDEPAVLMPKNRLATVLKRLAARGHAVLVVEHDLRLVASIADTVTVIDDGRVIAQRPTRRGDRRRHRPSRLSRRVIRPGEIVAVVGHDGGPARLARALVQPGDWVRARRTARVRLADRGREPRSRRASPQRQARPARQRLRALPASAKSARARPAGHALGWRAAAARDRPRADRRARAPDPRGPERRPRPAGDRRGRRAARKASPC